MCINHFISFSFLRENSKDHVQGVKKGEGKLEDSREEKGSKRLSKSGSVNTPENVFNLPDCLRLM